MNEVFPGEEQDILDEEYDSLCAQVVRLWSVSLFGWPIEALS
jgi:hypothetical protein